MPESRMGPALSRWRSSPGGWSSCVCPSFSRRCWWCACRAIRRTAPGWRAESSRTERFRGSAIRWSPHSPGPWQVGSIRAHQHARRDLTVELVRLALEKVEGGDVPAVVAALDDGIDWHSRGIDVVLAAPVPDHLLLVAA